MKVELKNPTMKKLNEVMKSYAKLYKNVELKYDYRKKKAILTLTGRYK